MRRRWILIPATLLPLLLLASCVERPFSLNLNQPNERPPQSQAVIALSDPQIYSREALVDDRRAELEYLRDLLKASESQDFEPEIHRQLSTVTALAAELGLKFDPLSGGAAAGAAALAELEREIRATRLRAQLLAARRELDAAPAGAGGLSEDEGGSRGGSDGGDFRGIDLEEVRKLGDDLGKLADRTDAALESLRDGTRRAETKASPHEVFRDRQAYRREIRSALDEVNLDDVHDAEGNALYRLQFRATVFPGRHKDKFGVARLSVRRPKLRWEDIDRLHKALLAHVTFRANRRGVAADLSSARLGSAGLFELRCIPLVPEEGDGACAESRNADRRGVWVAIPREMSDEADDFLERLDVVESKPEATSRIDALRRRRDELYRCLGPDFSLNAVDEKAELEDYTDAQLLDYCAAIKSDAWLADIASVIVASAEGWTRRADSGSSEARLVAFRRRIMDSVFQQVRRRFQFGREETFRQLGYCDEAIATRSSDRARSAQPDDELEKVNGNYAGSWEDCAEHADAAGDSLEDWDAHQPIRPWTFAERVAKLRHDPDSRDKWEPGPSCGDTRVYSAAPREFSQRVSTISNVADAVQLAAGLSALIPGQGLGVDAGIDRLQYAVGQAEAIERAPVIVGFSERTREAEPESVPATTGEAPRAGEHGEGDASAKPVVVTPCPQPPGRVLSQVGWVFGPKAHLEHEGRTSNLRKRQIVANHPVTADVAMPGWWPWVELELETAWVGNWYEDCCGDTADVLASHSDTQGSRRKTFRVDLPLNRADLDGLLSYLTLASFGRAVRQTRIDGISPEVVSACSGEQSILVYGTDVWRSTEAYLAGRRHTEIRVLPDMEGVAITFDLNEIPRPLPADEETQLAISTRSGSVRHAIEIRGAEENEPCPDT